MELVDSGLISADDLHLIHVTKNPAEAMEHIDRFYRIFHSYRFVRDAIVIRLNTHLPAQWVEHLERDFFRPDPARGRMVQSGPLPDEADEPHLDRLPRLIFPIKRGNYGRLRLLIDRINQTPSRTYSPPPMSDALPAWLIPLIFGLMGACIGSFLNVVIYRTPLGISVNDPARSFCPECEEAIPWYLNIPVLSWLALRGKSACFAERASASAIASRDELQLIINGQPHDWSMLFHRATDKAVISGAPSPLTGKRSLPAPSPCARTG